MPIVRGKFRDLLRPGLSLEIFGEPLDGKSYADHRVDEELYYVIDSTEQLQYDMAQDFESTIASYVAAPIWWFVRFLIRVLTWRF